MSTRKEKVTKAQERRKQPAVKAEKVLDGVPAVKAAGVAATGVPAVKAQGVAEPVVQPAMQEVAAPVEERIAPTVQNLYYPEYVQNSRRPGNLVETDEPYVEPVSEVAAKAPVVAEVAAPAVAQNPVTNATTSKPAPAQKKPAAVTAAPSVVKRPDVVPVVSNGIKDRLPQGVTASTESGVPNTNLDNLNAQSAQQEVQQPQTLSDMLAPRLEELREKAETEKTDAQKMQRYYALTDALKSLGKMGGSAIGGAIGGDMLGGAPTVGEYKESRGYLDAFEKAKQANDRLRALDDKEFQLAEKDADRSYQQQVAKAEREYKAAQAQIDRDWQITFFDYKTKIEQALAEKNMALAQQYKLELMDEENKAKAAYQSVQNAHDEKLKNLSLQIAYVQNNPNKKSTAVRFNDGNSVAIPDWLYESLEKSLIGSVVNGRTVKNSNVSQIIKDNPEVAYEFLRPFQIAGIPAKIDDNWAASVIGNASFPQHITQVPESEMAVRPQQGAAPKKDFSANKRKK